MYLGHNATKGDLGGQSEILKIIFMHASFAEEKFLQHWSFLMKPIERLLHFVSDHRFQQKTNTNLNQTLSNQCINLELNKQHPASTFKRVNRTEMTQNMEIFCSSKQLSANKSSHNTYELDLAKHNPLPINKLILRKHVMQVPMKAMRKNKLLELISYSFINRKWTLLHSCFLTQDFKPKTQLCSKQKMLTKSWTRHQTLNLNNEIP